MKLGRSVPRRVFTADQETEHLSAEDVVINNNVLLSFVLPILSRTTKQSLLHPAMCYT